MERRPRRNRRARRRSRESEGAVGRSPVPLPVRAFAPRRVRLPAGGRGSPEVRRSARERESSRSRSGAGTTRPGWKGGPGGTVGRPEGHESPRVRSGAVPSRSPSGRSLPAGWRLPAGGRGSPEVRRSAREWESSRSRSGAGTTRTGWKSGPEESPDGRPATPPVRRFDPRRRRAGPLGSGSRGNPGDPGPEGGLCPVGSIPPEPARRRARRPARSSGLRSQSALPRRVLPWPALPRRAGQPPTPPRR